ncbi:energy transducer TonB [Candidatus Margulisiibacteriota bacterium]
MIKTQSFLFPKIGVAVILAAALAYTILIFPKVMDTGSTSTLVFTESVVEVRAVPQAKTVAAEKVVPKASPLPLPIAPSRVLYSVAPVYPSAARTKGIEGVVMVKALIGKDGKLIRTQVKRSSGSNVLDAAAVSSLGSWKFSPAKRGVGSVKSWLEIPFKFVLR